MAKLDRADWWAIRRAHNRKPANYRCPLRGYQLPASRDERAHVDCA